MTTILEEMHLETTLQGFIKEHGISQMRLSLETACKQMGWTPLGVGGASSFWDYFYDLDDDVKTEIENEITVDTVNGMAVDTQGQFIRENLMQGVDYDIVEIVTEYLAQATSQDKDNIAEIKELLKGEL